MSGSLTSMTFSNPYAFPTFHTYNSFWHSEVVVTGENIQINLNKQTKVEIENVCVYI